MCLFVLFGECSSMSGGETHIWHAVFMWERSRICLGVPYAALLWMLLLSFFLLRSVDLGLHLPVLGLGDALFRFTNCSCLNGSYFFRWGFLISCLFGICWHDYPPPPQAFKTVTLSAFSSLIIDETLSVRVVLRSVPFFSQRISQFHVVKRRCFIITDC